MESVNSTVKHDIKINVWGCFSAHGAGSIRLVEGNSDQYQYMEKIKKRYASQRREPVQKRRRTFQQDNDPKHTAKHSQMINSQEVPLSEWLAQTPDLNPIENFWSIMDQRCSKGPTTAENSSKSSTLRGIS